MYQKLIKRHSFEFTKIKLNGSSSSCNRRNEPHRHHLRTNIISMANPVRVARVSKQMTREIADIFTNDKVIARAFNRNKLIAMEDMATVTDIYVSGDLQVAKVYISLYNTENYDMEKKWENLLKLQPYVKKLIGQRINLRRTPDVRFILDEGYGKINNAYDLLEKLEKENDGIIETEEDVKDEIEDEIEDIIEDEIDNIIEDEEIIDSAYAFADMFNTKTNKKSNNWDLNIF